MNVTPRLLVFAIVASTGLSGCAWLRERLVPTEYIQSKIDPQYVRQSFFVGTNCPGSDPADEMVLVGKTCVDKFEASLWSRPFGGTQLGNQPYPCNINGSDCGTKLYAKSVRNVLPAATITWFQAAAACAASGKRLLTNSEWQAAAAGTSDGSTQCNVSSASSRRTDSGSCVSAYGVEDMAGNLAEWVADWTQANTRNDGGDVTRPEFGLDKITGIDEAAPESYRLPATLIRGGSYLDGDGAGVFALDAQNAPIRARATIGFRCAR